MPYFAEVKNNIVRRVIVTDQEFINQGSVGDPDNWVETFIDTPSTRYAGLGDTYDPESKVFTAPPDPPEE